MKKTPPLKHCRGRFLLESTPLKSSKAKAEKTARYTSSYPLATENIIAGESEKTAAERTPLHR